MFFATVYKQTIQAKHLSQLKQQASRIANKQKRAYDFMKVTTPWGAVVSFARINRITPWGTVERGMWR